MVIAVGVALLFLWPLVGFLLQALFIGGVPALVLGVVGLVVLKLISWMDS